MIRVDVQVDSLGMLKSISMGGHAINESRVCAAISHLAITLSALLEEKKGIFISGVAEKPGSFYLKIERVFLDMHAWFWGATNFFIRGCELLQEKYPDQIKILMTKVK
jgi:uncharacterized protein YsxB (DUF464 family)